MDNRFNPPCQRTFFITGLFGFLIGFSLIAVTVQAQSLEERVRQLEEQLDDQEQSSDGYPTGSTIGGRIQSDWTFNVDESDDYNDQLGDSAADGFEFRRVWLNSTGSISQNMDYKLQIGFNDSSGKVSVKDAYINVTDLPILSNLKIGQSKEPFSLTEMTPNNFLTFMERANLQGAFAEGRQPGLATSARFLDGKINGTVGIFTPENDEINQPLTSGDYNFSARVTSPLFASPDYSELVHLGFALGRRGDLNGTYKTGVGPELNNGGARLLEVGVGDVENSDLYGLELATVHGPFSFQAEHAELTVNRTSGKDYTLESSYLMGSYFLTGERRNYNPGSGAFGRITPKEPFRGGSHPESGSGAWEIAARWSNTDFTDVSDSMNKKDLLDQTDDSMVAGRLNGEADIGTVALNWYPTSHTRWMLNYVDADQDDADVDAQWIATRFQVDF